MKNMKRIYETIVREHLGMYRQMVFLSGPRQVGKTTIAKTFASDYLNWEEKETRLLVLKGARAVGQSLALDERVNSGKVLVFDEIHRYQKWKTFLKGFFDVYEKSVRIFATGSAKMDVYKSLEDRSDYKKDDIVVGTLYLISNNFGAFVAVDDKYSALIPKKEMFGAAEKLVAGMKVTARVARVMDDGRLELAVRDKGYMQRNEDADKIFEMLKASGGKLDFYDKSDPELIREKTGMSKNVFKRAVGKLLKEDKIDIGEGTISLRN